MLPSARKISASEVPVIDLAQAWSGDSEAHRATIAQIRLAASDTGFMYLKNHGVPQAEIDAIFQASKEFHSLPEEAKMEVSLERNADFQGYLRSGVRGDDFKGKENTQEAFQFSKSKVNSISWPVQLPNLKYRALRYCDLMAELGYKVLSLFEEALDLPEGDLSKYYRPNSKEQVETQSLRLVRYPPQEPGTSGDNLGARAHTDTDAITMLYQDSNGGLEIRRRNGEWLAIPPIPGTFVLNVGEVLKVWSDGIFTSSTHRVINRSANKRYSVVFFFDPLWDTVVSPVLTNPNPESIAQEDLFTAMPRDKPFVFGEFKAAITKRILPGKDSVASY